MASWYENSLLGPIANDIARAAPPGTAVLEVGCGSGALSVRRVQSAQANRDTALRLARQAGHTELTAWTVQALASWALADGRFRDALDLARAGQDLAPPATAAAVQLALDEAQAWAALGDRAQAAAARHHAALTHAMLPGDRPGPAALAVLEAGAPGIA